MAMIQITLTPVLLLLFYKVSDTYCSDPQALGRAYRMYDTDTVFIYPQKLTDKILWVNKDCIVCICINTVVCGWYSGVCVCVCVCVCVGGGWGGDLVGRGSSGK